MGVEKENQSLQPSVPPDSVETVSYFRLFEGVSVTSRAGLCIGILCVGIVQVMMAMLPLFIGKILEKLVDVFHSKEETSRDVNILILGLAIAALVIAIASFLCTFCFLSLGQEVGYLYRTRYFHALLNKRISYFDFHPVSQLPHRMTTDCRLIEDGAGYHLMLLLYVVWYAVAMIAVSFFISPQLTLLCLGLTAAAVLVNLLCTVMYTLKRKAKDSADTKASGIAAESLTELKTVASYTAEDYFAERYEAELARPMAEEQQAVVWKGLGKGIGAMEWMVCTAVVFWVGAVWLENHTENWIWGDALTGVDVFIVFWFSAILAIWVGNFHSALQTCLESRNACSRAVAFIEEPVEFVNGTMEMELKGSVQFRDIHFAYPTIPDKSILNGVTFTCEPGERTAIVGESGEGKSTLLQLLERFYEPTSGTILLDEVPIQTLDIRCMRRQIAYVSQEPILFNLTIKENILLGRTSASDLEVETAARSAVALEFIQEQGKGFDAQVGLKGSLLSAGEKQRIAIARALIRNPKILILDEATSALDSENERIIITSLRQVYEEKHMTTICVAQKLALVENYEKIVVLQGGQVAEQGSHRHLCELAGRYYTLWKAQQPVTTLQRTAGTVGSISKEITPQSTVFRKERDAVGNIESTSVVFRLLKSLLYHWPLAIICVVATIGTGFVYPIMAYYLTKMALSVIIYSTDDSVFPGFDLTDTVEKYAIDVLLFGAMILVFYIAMEISFGLIVARTTKRLRSEVYRHMLHLDAQYIDQEIHSHDRLPQILNSDVDLMVSAGAPIVSTVLFIVAAYLIVVAFTFYWEWKLGLLVMVWLPIQAICLARGYTITKDLARREESHAAKSIMIDSTRNLKTVAAYQIQADVEKEYTQALQTAVSNSRKSNIYNGLRAAFGFSTVCFGFALVFWYGNMLRKAGHVEVVAVSEATYAICYTALGIALMILFAPSALDGIAAAERIYALLDYQPQINAFAENSKSTEIRGEVVFKDVCFAYPNRSQPALRNLSFDISPLRTVGLMGPSGAGKSTIIQLILRFYDVSEGQITIDGIDIRHYDVKHLRRSIALVSQEPVLFSGSVRANVDFGLGKSDEEIKEAMHKASLTRFTENLDREVGVRGSQFSGGQKQRLAIARALLRSPGILILDEATSALDSLTEKKVMDALQIAVQNRTVLVIAQRLSTLEKCDDILVVDSGSVVERGSHRELLSRTDSLYSHLLLSLHPK